MKSLLAAIHRHLFRTKLALRSSAWSAAQGARPAGNRVLVSGFMRESYGIGRAGALTVDGLRAAGYEVAAEDLRPFDRGLLTLPPAPFPKAADTDIWLIHANAPETEIALFTHEPAAWRHLYRIGYWAWESDLAPASWVAVSRYLHEIWTPSRFAAQALARAGVAEAKLRVVPHPVPPVGETSTRFDKGRVRVLTLFDPKSSLARKNPEGAVTAWLRAFPEPQHDAELIVKTLKGGTLSLPNRPDIVWVAETLTDDAQAQLLESCDMVLSLHRGEGYGLPLAEAMARGIPVIATAWSGNLEFMTADNALLVPATLVPASGLYNGPRAQWAEPDLDAAAQAIRSLVADPKRRHALGEKAHADMAALYRSAIDAISCRTR